MTDPTSASGQALMDELLRGAVPEIKLALGQLIDRENERPLPARYARLLPDSVLRVTLRNDAADALAPIAADLEKELTASCNRHGSLYDRGYKVQLQRTGDDLAPLYAVEIQAQAGEAETGGNDAAPSAPDSAPAGPIPVAPAPAATSTSSHPEGWIPGRWILVVEEDDGDDDREVFRIHKPVSVVGRATDGADNDIGISDAPHVSRRQLALEWDERAGEAGFAVVNLGLNPIHVGGADIPGAQHRGDGADLSQVGDEHRTWIAPGQSLRIGEQGPTVRIEEIDEGEDEVPVDPDATMFG